MQRMTDLYIDQNAEKKIHSSNLCPSCDPCDDDVFRSNYNSIVIHDPALDCAIGKTFIKNLQSKDAHIVQSFRTIDAPIDVSYDFFGALDGIKSSYQVCISKPSVYTEENATSNICHFANTMGNMIGFASEV